MYAPAPLVVVVLQLEEAMPEKKIQVAFRFSEDLVARIDAEAAHMSSESPGMSFTRADVVRVLLTQALDNATQGRGGRTSRGKRPKGAR